MTALQDDEWEYEYDETETEDFYIPLDLSNVPNEQAPVVSAGRTGHPTLLKSRLRAINAQRNLAVETAMVTSAGQETTTMGELQIAGLDTPNPLVLYNGQLLSCHWASTIGTDMFFVKPDSNADTLPSPPVRSFPSVDLLALGSAKLIAKVGRLRPRDDLFEDKNDAKTQTQPPLDAAASSKSQPVPESLDSMIEETRSAPLGFLARLNEAKAARGETSRLVISTTSKGSRLVSDKVEGELGGPSASQSQRPEDIVMGGT